MLDIKLLALIINEVGKLSLRRNGNRYKLVLYINCTDLVTHNCVGLSDFIKCFNTDDTNYLFNYDYWNNCYYAYGSNAFKVLALIVNELQGKVLDKANLVFNNENLFTRSSGKKLTEEELTTLKQLYLKFKELNEN